jgi:hypothetical protein
MLSAGSISYSLNNDNKFTPEEQEQKDISDIINDINKASEHKIKVEPSNKEPSKIAENLDKNIKDIEHKTKEQQLPENKLDINNIINIIKYKDQKDSMSVVFDNTEATPYKFSFYDNKQTLLGSFNVLQIIKFFGMEWEPKFMESIDLGLSPDLIKKMLGEIIIDKDTNRVEIKLKSHLESPFMGNIEMLIKLNNGIREYEIKHLENDLLKLENQKLKKRIRLTIKQFIYILLNHALKVIAHISEEIKNDPSRKELADTLLKYSIGITYRISSFVRDQLDLQIYSINALSENMVKLLSVRKVIASKMNSMIHKIEKENDKIDDILEKMNIQKGGEITSLSSNSQESPNTEDQSSDKKQHKKLKQKVIKISSSSKSISNMSELFDTDDSNNNFLSETDTNSEIDSLTESEFEDSNNSASHESAIYNL